MQHVWTPTSLRGLAGPSSTSLLLMSSELVLTLTETEEILEEVA